MNLFCLYIEWTPLHWVYAKWLMCKSQLDCVFHQVFLFFFWRGPASFTSAVTITGNVPTHATAGTWNDKWGAPTTNLIMKSYPLKKKKNAHVSHLTSSKGGLPNHLIDVGPLSDTNRCNCSAARELKKWAKWTSDSGSTSRELLRNSQAVTNCMLPGLSVLESVHIFLPSSELQGTERTAL